MKWRRKRPQGPAPTGPPWGHDYQQQPRKAGKRRSRPHVRTRGHRSRSSHNSSGSFSRKLYHYLKSVIIDSAKMMPYFMGLRKVNTVDGIRMSFRFFWRLMPLGLVVSLGVGLYAIHIGLQPTKAYTEFVCKPDVGTRNGNTLVQTHRRWEMQVHPSVGPLQPNTEYELEYRRDDPHRVIYKATPTGRAPYGYPCGIKPEDLGEILGGGK